MKSFGCPHFSIGNPVATIDDNAVVSLIDMNAFGEVQSGGYDGPRLTTKHYNGASGLYYFGARWYDPFLARWAEKDPLPFINGYLPMENNSVNYIDPDGKQIAAAAAGVAWCACEAAAFVGSAATAAYVCVTGYESIKDNPKPPPPDSHCIIQWLADQSYCGKNSGGDARWHAACMDRARSNYLRCQFGGRRQPMPRPGEAP